MRGGSLSAFTREQTLDGLCRASQLFLNDGSRGDLICGLRISYKNLPLSCTNAPVLLGPALDWCDWLKEALRLNCIRGSYAPQA